MVRIPQYTRSVTPQNTPFEYVRSSATPEAFGVGVSQAANNTGNSMIRFGEALADLKKQYDNTKLIEFKNYIDNWSPENLFDKDKGYYYKTGKDAMGKSGEVMESFDKYADDYLTSAGFTGAMEVRARDIIQRTRNGIQIHVMAHDKQETDAWQDMVYTDAFKNTVSKGVQNRNSENDIAINLKDGMTLLDNYAVVKGWSNDPETMTIKKKQFEENFYSQILDAYLAEDSLKSREFFDKNKDKFSTETANKYLEKVHKQEVDYSARTTAQNLVNVPTEDAYKFIDGIENIEQRDAVESEYVRLLRHKDTIQTQKDKQISAQIMQQAYAAFDRGEDIASVMREVNLSDMSLEAKEKIYNNLKTAQELKGAGNNWADYNVLLDMAAFDNENFINVNPAYYDLTKEQYQKIVEMQRKAANNEYTPEVEIRKQIKDLGFSTNFLPFGGLDSKEYENEIVKFLSNIERKQGRAFDFTNKAQLQAVVEGFNYKDKNAINKNIDETKELYMRAKQHGEMMPLVTKEYMRFKGENKREPNPEELFEMVKRSYNTVETEWRERDAGKLNQAQRIYRDVVKTVPKKGETRVLTYYADVRIPQISKELNIPLKVTSRYRAGDTGNHGKGIKCDVSMSELNTYQREQTFEKLLSEPAVESIGTSDPILLNKYNKPVNPKIRDLRNYDNNYKKSHPKENMNHVNHIDIKFNTDYGSDKQGKA